MAGANVLSDEALAQVRDVVRQVMGSLGGSQPLPRAPIAAGPEVFIIKAESAIPARDADEPGKLADVPLYYIDRTGPTIEALLLNDGETPNARDLYNVTETEIEEGDYAIVWRDKLGSWLAVPMGGESVKLVELCAQETAERNVPYLCWKGEWDEEKLRYCYDAEEEVYAIDHRMGAPFAEEGWKGLYQRMPADFLHGEVQIDEIWVCVSLDCELPPEGCACVDEES
jgi:hypothetical protein